MSYHTQGWEYNLAQAYELFDEASDSDKPYDKIDKIAKGLMNLCDYLKFTQEEYLSGLKESESDD